jgi:biopolymer transport protein ExbD
MGKRKSQTCEIDMTPMIDVVFQLMIFFLVTINMSDSVNTDIKLERGPHGQVIDGNMDKRAFTVEVDQKGSVSIHNLRMDFQTLRSIIRGRYNRMGEFPLVIRGDLRTQHKDIRKVMDMCTEIGVYRVWFAAIQKDKHTQRTLVGANP